MNKPKIIVILGSIREGRAGEKVAKWFMDTMKDTTLADLELVDLKDYPMPFFTDAQTPSQRTGLHADPAVQKWLDKVASADGYIIITPEYNHSFPAVLKNALDYPYKEWNNKPVGFVGYGGYASGSRAVEQLRQVVAELQMYDVREQVLIHVVWTAFDDKGNLLNPELPVRMAKALVEKVAKVAVQMKS